MTNVLRRSILLAVVLGVAVSYPAAILMLGEKRALETGNVILLSLSCGIVVAYAMPACRAFKHALVDGAAILSVGIFASWFGVMIARGGSIIWRLLDQPVDWLNSGWWGTHMMLSAIGAMCHLIAPEAVAGRVPTKYWVKVGLLVAAAVFCMAILTVVNSSD